MKKRYVIGMDFGTLSARAILLDLETGKALPRDCTYVYPHAILTEIAGTPVPDDFAIEHPADYIEALAYIIRGVIRENGISAEEIEGIGIDSTDATLIPITRDLVPLGLDPRFEKDPHAYVKMWKHHRAQTYMETVRSTAKAMGENFPSRCGAGISVEMTIPKLVEIVKESPAVYQAADHILHIGDFLVSLLTGKVVYSSAYACLKDGWDRDAGFASCDYLKALDPLLANAFTEKLGGTPLQSGTLAGHVCEEWAQKTGLSTDTAVAAGFIDGQVSFLSAGIEKNVALVSLGTSSGFVINSEEYRPIGGIMSCGRGALLPDVMTYDAGLAAVGDLLDWFVRTSVPASYEAEAAAKGINVHALLTEKASSLAIGESGLLALGWWNGNRCTLANDNLSGVLVGMRLTTRPEDIYRALIESTAFGMKNIMNNYLRNGLAIDRLMVTGGIAQKNPLLMQIYADVLDRELCIIDSKQCTALGSAISATVASGRFPDARAASLALRPGVSKIYSPSPEGARAYAALFEEYMALHDHFGKKG